MEELISEILEELKIELSVSDDTDIALLESKIKGAIREVKLARNYKNRFTSDFINADIQNYFQNIKNIAMYDFSQIGGEFETSHSESGTNRTWKDRRALFDGIVPFAECF